MNTVDVGLLRCELDIVLDFGSYVSQKLVIDELADDGMLVRRRFGVFGGIVVEDLLFKKTLAKSFLSLLGR